MGSGGECHSLSQSVLLCVMCVLLLFSVHCSLVESVGGGLTALYVALARRFGHVAWLGSGGECFSL